MLHGRDLLKLQGKWTVGSGANLSISDDRWLASGAMAVCKDGCSILKVSELIDHSSHTWDVSKLRDQNLQPASATEAIKTPIYYSDPIDNFFWPLTEDGIYSVKSGYKFLLEATPPKSIPPSSSYSHSEMSWSVIWSSIVPGRVKHFVWRLKVNALANRKNLFLRKIVVDSLCPICKNEAK